MRNYLIFLCAFTLLFFSQCGESDSGTSGSTSTEGGKPQAEKIYKKYCVNCHGANGKMGMSGAKDLTQSTLSLEEKKHIIANGKGVMTPFKNILSREEIHAVARYTLKFSDSHEE